MSDISLKQASDVGIRKLVNCWEVLECQEKECPAYKTMNVRCWAVQGTCCHSKVQGNFLDKIAFECRIISIPNVLKTEDPCVRSQILAGEIFVAHHAVPIIAKGNIKGDLELFHRSELIPDLEWLKFFEALAAQAAIAIDNATLFDELQRSNIKLTLAYDTPLERWSHALDVRDRETDGHTLYNLFSKGFPNYIV